MRLAELSEAILAICPILGINSDGVIWYASEATDDQKMAAISLMDSNFSTLDLSI